uniref:Uncharacterized protein n=1 Tax=Anopheles dirus TaxID=7168 RepID=A0A182N0L6_9DIPT
MFQNCDVNCHKKCEKLAANLCGVNQKLIVEALASVRRGVHEARDSPSKVPPSANPAYRIETPIPALTPPDAGGTALATTSGAAASATTAVPKEEDIGNTMI